MQRLRTHYQPQKTNVLAQGTTLPYITINSNQLEVADKVTHLVSTISSNLSLNKEICRHMDKDVSALTALRKNPGSISRPKLSVYNACLLSTLLYQSRSWTTYAAQEHRLNVFHMWLRESWLGYNGRAGHQA